MIFIVLVVGALLTPCFIALLRGLLGGNPGWQENYVEWALGGFFGTFVSMLLCANYLYGKYPEWAVGLVATIGGPIITLAGAIGFLSVVFAIFALCHGFVWLTEKCGQLGKRLSRRDSN